MLLFMIQHTLPMFILISFWKLRVLDRCWPESRLYPVTSTVSSGHLLVAWHMVAATHLFMELFQPVKPTSWGTIFSQSHFVSAGESLSSFSGCFESFGAQYGAHFLLYCLNIPGSKYISFCSTFYCRSRIYSSALSLLLRITQLCL